MYELLIKLSHLVLVVGGTLIFASIYGKVVYNFVEKIDLEQSCREYSGRDKDFPFRWYLNISKFLDITYGWVCVAVGVFLWFIVIWTYKELKN